MPRQVANLTASVPQPQEPRLLLEALRNAIDTAQPGRLRLVLWSLCNESTEAATIGRTLLLVPEDEDDEADEEDEEEEEEEEEEFESEEEYNDNGATARVLKASPIPKAPKRLRPRFATCEHCSKEFDVTENEDDACIWHDGEREADHESDIWTDWDEGCHGRISDQEDQYPEGFTWTCCDEPGDADGCNTGPHAEEEDSHKRARY